MPLVILTAPFIYRSVPYVASDVIDVDSDVSAWITITLSIARPVAAGPAAWSAGSYAINNLVSVGGNYFVNDAAATSGDVPGTAPKWVQVRYLPLGAGGSSGGSSLASEGDNYKIENGSFFFKTPSGTARKPVPTDTAEGVPSSLGLT